MIAPNRIRELFFSRTDAFAVQMPDGVYKTVRQELTDEDIEAHLRGEIVLGSYQLAPDNTVRWICFDFDAEDGNSQSVLPEAKRLVEYIKSKDAYRNAYMWEFTGNRGFHVFLFLKPIPAFAAMALAHQMAKNAGVECEIFPKQAELPPGGLGNLVKVPLGRHMKSGKWSVVLEPEDPMAVEPTSIPAEVLSNLPPPRVAPEGPGEAVGIVPLAGCIAMARLCDGVAEGMRDEAAFFLARVCYATGFKRNMALALLREWNRYNHPPLTENTLEDKVKSAYRRGYLVGTLSVRKNEVLNRLCEGCRRRICLLEREKDRKKAAFRMNEGVWVI
jgi:hypothetical protein